MKIDSELSSYKPPQNRTEAYKKSNNISNSTKNSIEKYLKNSSNTGVANIGIQLEVFSFKFKEPAPLTLKEIGYDGKPIEKLTEEEAKELVSEDGFFGISKTAQRLAEFVLSGASDNENLLRAGREGVITGFKQAEDLWGEKLPEISYKSLEMALAKIDERMVELGYSVLNIEA